MTLGVDDYLAWRPAEMDRAAHWFSENSRLLDRVAKTVREGVERGTEEQWGEFIESIRSDGGDAATEIELVADLMLEASTTIRDAGADLASAVGSLRDVGTQLREEGYERIEGEHVGDRRSTYENADERIAREGRAEEFRDRIWELLSEIREIDDKANRDLHAIVDRDVRDRTDLGNGAPKAVFAAGGGETAVVAALASTAAHQFDEAWKEAMSDSSRGKLGGGLTFARRLGPIASGLGFIGAAADRPEGEPLYETIFAEGAGVVGGLVGGPLGFAASLLTGGPKRAVSGYFGGTLYGSMKASSEVREAFDRAN